MKNTFYKKKSIIRFNNGEKKKLNDYIVEEIKTNVKSNFFPEFTLTSSPWDIEELALGAAYNRGFIKEKKYKETNNKLKITKEKVIEFVKELESTSDLFIKTGGVHNAFLCTNNEILCRKNDIGRHNVIDRIAGFALINNISLQDKIIVFSGREPFEIIDKIKRMKIKIFISVAAPTTMGIELAKDAGITLIGFARGNKFNVYTNSNRVIF
ncbi:MAG: formate dehydrogenase accessory sulfurtransferase FdhD [Eubacteriales bacterium]|nr:formate dehydrogenase accessory sulfurtransferase FdhD [Eubacteriales bacterium]